MSKIHHRVLIPLIARHAIGFTWQMAKPLWFGVVCGTFILTFIGEPDPGIYVGGMWMITASGVALYIGACIALYRGLSETLNKEDNADDDKSSSSRRTD